MGTSRRKFARAQLGRNVFRGAFTLRAVEPGLSKLAATGLGTIVLSWARACQIRALNGSQGTVECVLRLARQLLRKKRGIGKSETDMSYDILKSLGLEHIDTRSPDFLETLERMQREALLSLQCEDPRQPGESCEIPRH